MVGESGITALGMIWGQYLTSGIAGKLYGTSTSEQTSTFSPAYPKCFLPKGGHRSDGHYVYHSVQDFKIRIRYDANADKGDELYDKCGQVCLPDST